MTDSTNRPEQIETRTLSTERRQALLRELIALFLIVALATFARSSLADHYHVPTGSMEHTILPGDRILVDKTAYGFRFPLTKIDLFGAATPKRGDIVVFDSPVDGTRLVKRVAAVGGDTVELTNGRLTVNGSVLAQAVPDESSPVEEFDNGVALLNLASGGGPDIASTAVPAGHVLLLGDHRGNSHDGRYFGFLHERELLGRAAWIYYRRETGFTWRSL